MCVCVYVVCGFGLGPYIKKKKNTPLGSDFKPTIPADHYFNGL